MPYRHVKIIVASLLLAGMLYLQTLPADSQAATISTNTSATPFDVRDFGAKGDGETDDTQAIQAALSKAKNTRQQVYLPKGNYIYSQNLVIDSVGMYGDDDGTRLISADPAHSAIRLTGHSPSIRHVEIRANATKIIQSGLAYGILVKEASNFVVDSCKVKGVGGLGIFMTASTRGVVSNNVVDHSWKDGIHVTKQSSDIIINGNTVNNSGDDGIAVVSYMADGGRASRISILNNIVDGGRARGISVVGGESVTIEGNMVKNKELFALYLASERPFNTYGALHVTVRNNTFIGTSHAGSKAIYIYDGNDNPPTGLTITNNNFTSRAADNLINGGRNIFLCGNSFGNLSGSGLRVTNNSGSVNIEHNAFSTNATSGIAIASVSSKNIHASSNAFGTSKIPSNSQNDCSRDPSP